MSWKFLNYPGKTFCRAARLADPNQRLWGATAWRWAHQEEAGQESEYLWLFVKNICNLKDNLGNGHIEQRKGISKGLYSVESE